MEVKAFLQPEEFHLSIRSTDLPASVAFYTSLLGAPPKEWTHRYAIFYRPELQVNFVILVNDGQELHHDTLYHLGVGVQDRQAVIEAEALAERQNWLIHQPARTTWRGTPLHELWLKDPDGNLIEIYARLTPEELAQMPEDQAPLFLTKGGAA
ncbi:glyoxalase [bacterium (Candidatus Blackallbacteria) CG17_big_fil_post_rev_8_21_14_2_50_48_46]|uniref:Glyoxalase n=1 Tax=bacterium (Candidatus Blackallbacteria) CG17_big_fil_post_rev_8_21_14_2_50_48_46 TaxID=2014261 RepID=A0A2M7G168_9BACT|nr:MAG: glyoxalase [bacterium (Candidatus Blackallbacteria) CG18_big_fil_WC_8_21_14_2_50_49_26]PIW15454.1 MAG: glyoxalase [bacterium (Candidatus Blackallbacteria) CG17_big_fil_post_rev_8_21_14_2_50_48_46]PIW45263.1 MAG: glyoxalase [bacterium (Candidatus Blackallbacteria) CG13_big_fil_rev_8_21_14_2_50_49_14]